MNTSRRNFLQLALTATGLGIAIPCLKNLAMPRLRSIAEEYADLPDDLQPHEVQIVETYAGWKTESFILPRTGDLIVVTRKQFPGYPRPCGVEVNCGVESSDTREPLARFFAHRLRELCDNTNAHYAA